MPVMPLKTGRIVGLREEARGCGLKPAGCGADDDNAINVAVSGALLGAVAIDKDKPQRMAGRKRANLGYVHALLVAVVTGQSRGRFQPHCTTW